MEQSARPAILIYVERASASVWRAALAPYAELALLGALLLPVVLGGVLPQAPPAVATDPGQYQQWLGALRSRWGGTADVLSSLGLLNIFRARLLYAWLAAIATAAGLRLLQFWAPALGIPSGRMIGVAPLALPYSAKEAWARVSRALAQAGMGIARTVQIEDTLWAWAQRAGTALVSIFGRGEPWLSWQAVHSPFSAGWCLTLSAGRKSSWQAKQTCNCVPLSRTENFDSWHSVHWRSS